MAKIVKNYDELKKNPAYELMYEEYLGDIKSSGIILKHKKSGARVAVMSNEDENKLFCAAFRTPPSDSTGVPHIIEHSVLNGSKNFPSRDPFMQLVKGSLNTFLNAMTYSDKTLYPVATCNDKDFENLMHVYLDAVFYPRIYSYPQIFMQEGWHYELEKPEDELVVNGVVYSEMKGATSSPDNAMWDTVSSVMFPDTTYGVNSGGDPRHIPELTYEQFCDFHARLYHPSNSYIFIYGNCDMDERLEFLDREYLSAFDEIEPNSSIPRQAHFGKPEPKRVIEKYSVGQTDSVEGKSFHVFASLGGSNLDVTEQMAASIAVYVLFNAEGAPVKQALLDAGIGEDVFGYYDSHAIEDTFAIVAKNAKSEDADRFYDIVMSVLKEQVKNGISEKALLATINSREFHFREADYGGYPRGLDIATDMLQSWLYDDSQAFTYMHYLDSLAELKEKVGTEYYEDIIRKYILNSDHCALITIDPERGLNDKREEELRASLAEYKASLTDEQLQKIIDDTAALREYQSRTPTEEEQNCIPSLERSDIPRESAPYCEYEECEIGGVKTILHKTDTNGITYANIYFDIGKIPQDYVPYLTVLGTLLGRLDTEKHTYGDLNFDILLNLGNLGFGDCVFSKYGKLDEYMPYFGVYATMLGDKVSFALDTAAEIILTSRFDKKRIRDILSEYKVNRRSHIIDSGNQVAAARARSYFSKLECYCEQLKGIDYYLFLTELLDNYDERADELIEKLKEVRDYVYSPVNMIMSLAADDDGKNSMAECMAGFVESLSSLKRPKLGEFVDYAPVKKNEGILIPSQVQYVAKVGNLGFDGLEYSGALQVVKSAVNIDYLYQEIRVKGGAYGCGCGFNASNGNVQFTSYRDPKLKETAAVYDGTGEFVKNYDFDEKELTKFIIGAFSDYDRPVSIKGLIARTFNSYMSGRSAADANRERAEMLDITKEQFNAAYEVFDKICAQGYLCAVGNETKLRENADMFDALITIN